MQKKIGQEYYARFMEASKSWIPVLYIKRDRTSPEWFAFIRYMSQSAMAFYSFHSAMKNEVYKQETEGPKRIYNFYADLIVSKLKKAIFTENPRDSVLDISALLFEDFKDVFSRLSSMSQEDFAKVKGHDLFYFYLKAFCYFDMTFWNDKPKVFFCRYKSNVTVRKQFCGHLEKLIEPSIKLLSNIKQDGSIAAGKDIYSLIKAVQEPIAKLPLNNLMDTVNYFHPGMFKNEDRETVYSTIFAPGFDVGSFAFDPLSRYYSYIIWKCLKILRASFKYIEKENNIKFIRKFTDAFTKYLKELKEILEMSAGGDHVDVTNIMNRLLDNDYQFIEKFIMAEVMVYERQGKLDEIPDVAIKLDADNESLKTRSTAKNVDVDTAKLKDIALNYIYDPAYLNKIRGPWKFENLILKAPIEDIQYLAGMVAGRIPLEYRKKPIIGILRSGSLMAYLYSIVTGNTEKIMHFEPSPFVSILPWSAMLPVEQQKVMSPLIFDESFKSGFTSDILNEYLHRKKEIDTFRPCLFSLARVLDYQAGAYPYEFSFLYSWDYHGIQTLSKEMIRVASTAPGLDIQKCLSIKEYLKDISEITDKSDFKASVRKMASVDDGEQQRYDVLRLFTSTSAFFAVANYFYKKITEEIESKKIFLVYGSDYAYVIGLAIALISKADENTANIDWNISSSAPEGEDVFRVFLDIEIFTGNTFLTKANEQGFDITCVIAFNAEALERQEVKEKMGLVAGIIEHNT